MSDICQPYSPKVTVSIIIPVYQAVDVLERCVTSVIEQDFPNIEILMVDDGSTDSSLSVAEDLQRIYQCIRIIRLSHGGVSTARNQGIKEATGEWLLFLDADDALCPGALQIIKNEMKPGCDAIYGMVVRDSCCADNMSSKKTLYTSKEKHELLNDVMADSTNKLTCHAWLLRRDIVLRYCIWFSTSLCMGEDSDWMIRYLSVCGNVCFLKVPVYRYTINADSTIHHWKTGITDGYLKTLTTIGESPVSQEKNWSLFVLTTFLLILTHDIFHPDNPTKLFEKIHYARRIKALRCFSDAFRLANYSCLCQSKRIVLTCSRYNLFFLVYIAVRIRQRQNLNHAKQQQ